MAKTEIVQFKGIVPRQQDTLLPLGFATRAHDVDLTHGDLRPWREPLPVAQVPALAKTVHPWGCCWRHWDHCVEVANWLADCPRLYVTGDRAYPTVEVLSDNCTVTTWRVGVPEPGAGPTASPFSAPTPTSVLSERRAYVYTYGNRLGEEGAPSWPGNEFEIDDGTAATVTGFSVPDAEWGVETINVYRRATGFIKDTDPIEAPSTDWFLVASVPVGTASFIDTLPNMELGPALGTRDFMPPPAELRGVTEISGTRTLVGFVGNTLRFCANGQPWNWPEAQVLTLDDKVRAIRETGGRIHVATDGHPYTVTGSLDCGGDGCRAVVRVEQAQPMVVCCTDRGAIETPLGMVYVGTHGLVLLHGVGQMKVLTDSWYATDDWRRMKPETMRLGYYAGALFCVSDAVSFVLHLDDTLFTQTETRRLTTISDKPVQMVTSRQGEMFLLDAGRVTQWNAGLTLRPYVWTSSDLFLTRPMHYVGAQLWADGAVDFTLQASGRMVYNRTTPSQTFRLPSYGHHVRHTVTIEGIRRVWGVNLATSLQELTNGRS